MVEKGLSGGPEDSGKLGPGIRGAHINNTDRFDPELWRLNTKQARRLAALDTAPELALSRDNEVLIEWIGVGGDLNPFAAAGDHGKDSVSGRDHPHVVLQLRHIFLSRRFFRERPGQHEFGFEHRPGGLDAAIEGG